MLFSDSLWIWARALQPDSRLGKARKGRGNLAFSSSRSNGGSACYSLLAVTAGKVVGCMAVRAAICWPFLFFLVCFSSFLTYFATTASGSLAYFLDTRHCRSCSPRTIPGFHVGKRKKWKSDKSLPQTFKFGEKDITSGEPWQCSDY